MYYPIPTTQKEFDYLVEGFQTRTLPAREWTHEAHLITGLWHVSQLGYAEALSALRKNIRLYNEATGGMNTDTSGYHDTITVFWVWLLNEFWGRYATNGQTFEQVCNQFLQSKYSHRNNALIFYTKDFLFSKEARLSYAEPDIQSLDFEKI
ncbi:hypothetical protein [Emticicia sp. 17c]|uniref:hypothetical protein n=1 Tax=Emticicia sp. 17c TaxID=3127704 RepID=UPI00301C9E2F